MFLVQLQYNTPRHSYFKSWSRVICGCEKEEDALRAGIAAINFYNNVVPVPEGFAGRGIIDDNSNMFMLDYTFAVKEHDGEWNPTKGDESWI